MLGGAAAFISRSHVRSPQCGDFTDLLAVQILVDLELDSSFLPLKLAQMNY